MLLYMNKGEIALKYTNIFDTHTHSDNSFDGNHTCILLCEGVIKNNGVGIAITDHCEIDSKDLDFRSFTTNQYVESFMAKKSFEDKIEVLQGIELGQAIYNKPLAEQILNDFNYDFVLGSIHNLENMEDFYFLDYKEYDIKELLTEYFNTIFELCKWNKFDSLAHLTYPLRYIYQRENIRVDLSEYNQIIDLILTELVKNEKALEINTSGLFMDIGETLPTADILSRFRELGGKYVTVGSDSHYYDKVCNGIAEGYDILKQCGFDHFTIFRKRKPVLIPIE